MKFTKVFVCIIALAILLSPISSTYAAEKLQLAAGLEEMVKDAAKDQMKKSVEEKATSEVKKAVGIGVGQTTETVAETTTGQKPVCSPESMRMMFSDDANRLCVVDGVMQDESATSMVMYKVASDPVKRKKMMEECQMMEKMEADKAKGVMEPKDMIPGQGSLTIPSSFLPKK